MSYSQQNLSSVPTAARVDYDRLHGDEQSSAKSIHDTAADPEPAVFVLPKVVTAEHLFRLTATLLAAVYALSFFGRLLWSYYAWDTKILNITWSMQDNPQNIIAICLVFGAAFLWLWKGAVGRFLALLSFGYVIGQFYLWSGLTNQIKLNTGRDVLPEAGRFGNVWFGSGWLEIIVLIATIALSGFALYFLTKDIKALFNKSQSIVTPLRRPGVVLSARSVCASARTAVNSRRQRHG